MKNQNIFKNGEIFCTNYCFLVFNIYQNCVLFLILRRKKVFETVWSWKKKFALCFEHFFLILNLKLKNRYWGKFESKKVLSETVKRVISYNLQKLFLAGLAIIAAVSADVSHLNLGNGYNYPQPSPSFHEELSLPIAPPPAPAPPVSVFLMNIVIFIDYEFVRQKRATVK